jgi:hypothetical protein
MIVDMLRRRLGENVTVSTVRPGDRLEIMRSTDEIVEVRHHHRASNFVREVPSAAPSWQPVDTRTLTGIESRDVTELRTRLEEWLETVFAKWLHAQIRDPRSPIVGLIVLEIVWMLVVHLGEGEVLTYHIDFRAKTLRIREGGRDDANYVAHVGADVLLSILRREAGSELLYLAGAWRGAERIMIARPDGIAPPPVIGWDLFERVPEPFSWCLRRVGV